MPRTIKLLTLALISIVALACRSTPLSDGAAAPASGVTIQLDRTIYNPGSPIELRMTNHTNEPVGYNACFRSIERRQEDGWSLIVEAGRVCTLEVLVLDPHATHPASTQLPATLERGTYRLVLSFTRETPGLTPQTRGARIRVTSRTFEVQ